MGKHVDRQAKAMQANAKPQAIKIENYKAFKDLVARIEELEEKVKDLTEKLLGINPSTETVEE